MSEGTFLCMKAGRPCLREGWEESLWPLDLFQIYHGFFRWVFFFRVALLYSHSQTESLQGAEQWEREVGNIVKKFCV